MAKDKWIICPDCEGNGGNSAHLGVINHHEWEHEDLEAYFEGAYDKQCESCKGSGKIKESQLEELEEKHQDYLLYCAESGISPHN